VVVAGSAAVALEVVAEEPEDLADSAAGVLAEAARAAAGKVGRRRLALSSIEGRLTGFFEALDIWKQD
jgi:hypothetical protein